MLSQCNKNISQVTEYSSTEQPFIHSFNMKRTQSRTHSRTVDRTLIIARRKVSSSGRYSNSLVVAWWCCCMLPTNYYTLNAPQSCLPTYYNSTLSLVRLKRSAYGYAHLALHNWSKQLNSSSFEVVWLLLLVLNTKSLAGDESVNYSMEVIPFPPTQFHSITNCIIIPRTWHAWLTCFLAISQRSGGNTGKLL